MARPRKKIDGDQIEKLAGIGCTVSEIAVVIGCHENTLHNRFCGRIKKGRENLKTSLRRMQYKAASGGNIAMLIWLGKQYLGQRDRMYVDVRELDHLIATEFARIAGDLEDEEPRELPTSVATKYKN